MYVAIAIAIVYCIQENKETEILNAGPALTKWSSYSYDTIAM